MVQRIVKMIGSAYSTSGNVHVQATYNGVEVLNGPVTTTVADVIPFDGEWTNSSDELVLFETTTDTTGLMPVSITVTGGTLVFKNFRMNYTGFGQERRATDPAAPIDPDDPDTYYWAVTVQPDSYYSDPNWNTVESDGIVNIIKNGEPWPWRMHVTDQQLGDWSYPIRDGETVTFDHFVDPAKVILSAPI